MTTDMGERLMRVHTSDKECYENHKAILALLESHLAEAIKQEIKSLDVKWKVRF